VKSAIVTLSQRGAVFLFSSAIIPLSLCLFLSLSLIHYVCIPNAVGLFCLLCLFLSISLSIFQNDVLAHQITYLQRATSAQIQFITVPQLLTAQHRDNTVQTSHEKSLQGRQLVYHGLLPVTKSHSCVMSMYSVYASHIMIRVTLLKRSALRNMSRCLKASRSGG
jgi:hypothetical protein